VRVVCIRPDSPLAAPQKIGVADFLSEPLIVMRSGYVMHRYLHRLLEGRTPSFSYTTDGAKMGRRRRHAICTRSSCGAPMREPPLNSGRQALVRSVPFRLQRAV
jgi:hypothetical protein